MFVEVPKIKFHKNLSRGRRADAYGQTDGRADVTKLIAAFRYLCERS